MPSLSAKILALAVLGGLALAVSDGAPPVAAQDTVSISGRVFHDLNGNGLPDPGEPGMAGWLVKLEPYRTEAPLYEEMKTDRDGRYSFGDLPAGEYDVALPCDGQPSLWGGTANEYTALGNTLEAGTDLKDADFPVVPLRAPPSQPHNGSIEGRIVRDEDRDAVVEPGEPGFAGLRMQAYAENQPVCFPVEESSAYSGPDGRFSFSGLVPGLYEVDPFYSGELAEGKWLIDAPGVTRTEGGYDWFGFSLQVEVPDRGTGSIAIGVISAEGTGSISGALYIDRNENGVRDPEDPFEGRGSWVALFYRTPEGYSLLVFAFQELPTEGRYEFSGLAAGDYLVSVAFGPGRPINPPVGPYDAPYFPLKLADGEQRTGVDFGFAYQPAEPTPEIVPTAEPASTPLPLPSATPLVVPPSVDCGPTCSSAGLSAPSTGAGGATVGNSAVNLAAALAVAAALVVSGAALLYRRQTRPRRASPPASE